MITFIFALVVLAFAFYVFSPLVTPLYRSQRWNPELSELESLRLRKQQILIAVSDLEYDMRMKKMSEEDYQQIKEKLMREGSAILEALARAEHPHPTPQFKQKRNRKKAVA